jgi:serpin B
MDFVDKSEECRLEINKWVEEQTKEKIKDLLQEGTIVPATNLVLANAVYFKGKWDKPFTADKTTECDFHVTASDISKVQMMHGKHDMLYFVDEAEKYSAVSMSYEWKTTSMVIVRPDQIDGLSVLEANFNVGKLMHSLSQSFMTKVDIALPKFTFTETTDLSQILPKLGITDLFDAANVDLSGMLEKTGLAISDVIHKAFIDVNEEGTEAAAATAMISRMMMMPMNEVSFVCDRPFLFMIVDSVTKFVHFIGRYTKP